MIWSLLFKQLWYLCEWTKIEETMDIVMKVLKQSELKNWNLETRLVDLGFDSLDTIDFIV